MTARPVLFSGNMVRAILAGRKTQTRRLCRLGDAGDIRYTKKIVSKGQFGAHFQAGGPIEQVKISGCPFGAPGDLLWVREQWALRADADHDKEIERWWLDRKGTVWHPASGDTPSGCGGGMGRTRPSIHMPRWASRITLRVESVRVEFLNAITLSDVKAEGFDSLDAFVDYWDTLHKPGHRWADNPWVWVVGFRRESP